jgi:histidinol phosphatase-like enzyme
MNKTNAFQGFKFEKPVVETLKVGNHLVRINSYSVTDSFHLLDGTEKEGIADEIASEEKWSDSTPQLAVVLMNKEGVMTYRFSANGYKQVSDYTSEQLEDEKYTVIDGYVCVRNKQKKLVRIVCEKRTAQAKRMLNQFLLAAKAKEGEDLFAILDRCVADKTEIGITVKAKQFNDEEKLDISSFKSAEAIAEKANAGIDSNEF